MANCPVHGSEMVEYDAPGRYKAFRCPRCDYHAVWLFERDEKAPGMSIETLNRRHAIMDAIGAGMMVFVVVGLVFVVVVQIGFRMGWWRP